MRSGCGRDSGLGRQAGLDGPSTSRQLELHFFFVWLRVSSWAIAFSIWA
jgi:hypothetical protein